MSMNSPHRSNRLHDAAQASMAHVTGPEVVRQRTAIAAFRLLVHNLASNALRKNRAAFYCAEWLIRSGSLGDGRNGRLGEHTVNARDHLRNVR